MPVVSAKPKKGTPTQISLPKLEVTAGPLTVNCPARVGDSGASSSWTKADTEEILAQLALMGRTQNLDPLIDELIKLRGVVDRHKPPTIHVAPAVPTVEVFPQGPTIHVPAAPPAPVVIEFKTFHCLLISFPIATAILMLGAVYAFCL